MKNKNSVIYVGPSLEHIVREGSVFRNGYPQKLKELMKEQPFLEELLVPVDLLAETKKAIRNPESSMRMLYRKAEKIRRKE